MINENELIDFLTSIRDTEWKAMPSVYREGADRLIKSIKSSKFESKDCLIHSTDWFGKCFICGKQVFIREDKGNPSKDL